MQSDSLGGIVASLLLLDSEFLAYWFVLWTADFVWVYVLERLVARRLSAKRQPPLSEAMRSVLPDVIGDCGIMPFILIWVFVTPSLFGEPGVPVQDALFLFQHWPETLLCLLGASIISDRIGFRTFRRLDRARSSPDEKAKEEAQHSESKVYESR